jgi:hypothetical protein
MYMRFLGMGIGHSEHTAATIPLDPAMVSDEMDTGPDGAIGDEEDEDISEEEEEEEEEDSDQDEKDDEGSGDETDIDLGYDDL